MDVIPETETLRKQVAAALPVLDGMGAQLRQTATQIETAVIDVCNRIQQIMARSMDDVKGASELLAGDVTGRSSESIGFLIEEAEQAIEILLRHTQHSAQVSQGAIERIEKVAQATNEITKSLAQLDDITLGNRLLAVNARIQAVCAGDRAAGFGGVANEIANQAHRSSEIVDLIRTVSGELRSIAQAALTDLKLMAAEDRTALARSKMEVDRVLDDFRRMHSNTQNFIEKMTRENSAVAEEISSAVHSLQFQKQINQGMGNVIGELDSLRHLFASHCQAVQRF